MARSSAGRSQMPHLTALKFRDENSPNVDDSGWVPLERVTALVGRNEPGKTAPLKALHKFNPADRDPFIAQFEFPRCRYVRDFKGNPKKPWPVVSVTFQIGTALRARLAILLERGHPPPRAVTMTRYYPADHTKAPYASRYAFQPAVTSPDPPVQRLLAALRKVEGEEDPQGGDRAAAPCREGPARPPPRRGDPDPRGAPQTGGRAASLRGGQEAPPRVHLLRELRNPPGRDL